MVDVDSGDEKLLVNLDISLPYCPCDVLSLDVVDVTGVRVVDVEGKVEKMRIGKEGEELGVMEDGFSGEQQGVDAV